MKTLICINTCKRASAIKAMIWDYVDFVKSNEDFDFLVSLDGNDTETISYCKKFNIPLIYSEANEGVGLSKNRVLTSFPDYDYYFFIEDDVELLNPDIFKIHIDLAQKTNLPHFSLFPRERIRVEKARTSIEEYTIIHSMYGSAQVNFFTQEGIQKVGGFHDEFSKYKRFGHTEHTYRFMHAGLSKYPFNIINECIDGFFGWNDPRSVTQINVQTTENRLFQGEEELINEKLVYYPINTASKFHITQPISNAIIGYDRYSHFHKVKFKTIMCSLNFFRSIKNMINTKRQRVSQ